MGAILDLWRQLPVWVRVPVSLGILAFGTFLFYFLGNQGQVAGRGPSVLIGLVVALGIVLLFTGPTDSERRGYHD